MVSRDFLHLSRLRGRSLRLGAAGGGSIRESDCVSGTPTPTLPRKRERELTAVAETSNQCFGYAASDPTD
jgi:hypothetical protein